MPPSDGRPVVLVLSWHPPGGRTAAGGFRRAAEIVDRFSQRVDVVTLDSRPSLYESTAATHVTYPAVALPRLSRRNTQVARVLQWSVAFGAMVLRGRRLVRKHKVTAIYLPFSELPHCALAAAIVAKTSGTRLVFANQNANVGIVKSLMVRLHNRADAVTAVSYTLKSQLEASGITTPITVTQNGPPTLAVPPVGSLERTVDGLFIGRITPEKGVFDALDIWELVCAEQPGRQLELVGPCSSDMRSELQQRIDASPHLRSNVHIRGLVDEAEKTRLLQSSRVLLATSHVEGWGFVPLEALQCGTPTVAWDLPAYAESLPQGDATQRVPMHHRAEFVARVRDLLALDDTQRAELVRSTSDHEVTWDDVSKAELAVITKELVIT